MSQNNILNIQDSIKDSSCKSNQTIGSNLDYICEPTEIFDTVKPIQN